MARAQLEAGYCSETAISALFSTAMKLGEILEKDDEIATYTIQDLHDTYTRMKGKLYE